VPGAALALRMRGALAEPLPAALALRLGGAERLRGAD
jgi:hypothetical protein